MATLITLVSFDQLNGEGPEGSLIMDAAGDLLGTATYPYGEVFEIARTGFGSATPAHRRSSRSTTAGQRALLWTPQVTSSVRRRDGERTMLARCSKSQTPAPATPTRQPCSPASTAQTAQAPERVCSWTPPATCSARHSAEERTTMAWCSGSPTPAPARPARQPFWPASTAQTANIRRRV